MRNVLSVAVLVVVFGCKDPRYEEHPAIDESPQPPRASSMLTGDVSLKFTRGERNHGTMSYLVQTNAGREYGGEFCGIHVSLLDATGFEVDFTFVGPLGLTIPQGSHVFRSSAPMRITKADRIVGGLVSFRNCHPR